MFLTQKAIEKAFPLLIKLDTQQGLPGKSRKEKVSALRHLFATSLVLNKLQPAKKLDLAVGNTVEYRDYPEAEPQTFTTRTPAEVLSGHTAVVWLNGKAGCVCVDACRKVVRHNV